MDEHRDSIREELTKDEILNEIRLTMSADLEDKQVVILVEGSDDEKWIENIFPDDKVRCFESFSGKNGLEELLDAVSEEPFARRIIAIRDRDYSDPDTYPARMFAYDYCCLEMMLLFHPEVQKGVRAIYIIESDELKRAEIPLNIMRLIAPFSLLQRKNEWEGIGIDFGKSGVLAGCGSNKLPDIRALFCKYLFEEQYERFRSEADALPDAELWEITNGHDLCALLGKSAYLGKGALGEDGIRNYMFHLYRFSDFQSTTLYMTLKNYQTENHLDFIES